MNVTFLVALNLDDVSSLADISNEINDDLSNSGFEVVSVQPWARPSVTTVPITTTQPINTNIQQI